MLEEFETKANQKKAKARRLALWAIGLGVGYPLLFALMLSLRDLMDRTRFGAEFVSLGVTVSFLAIPVLISVWVLAIWSLKLRKSELGIMALILAVLLLLGLAGILYALSQICIIC